MPPPAVGARISPFTRRLAIFRNSRAPRPAEIRLSSQENEYSLGDVSVHEVTSKWSTTGEGILQGVNGWIAKNGDATWDFSEYPEKKWKTQGGDFKSDVVVSSVKPMGDVHWFGSTKLMKRLVQDWIDGTVDNNGIILVGDEGESDPFNYSIYYGQKNSPEFVPRLIITYTSPSQGYPHTSSGLPSFPTTIKEDGKIVEHVISGEEIVVR